MSDGYGSGAYDDTGYHDEGYAQGYSDEGYAEQDGFYDTTYGEGSYAETVQEDDAYAETIHDGYIDAASLAESYAPTVVEEEYDTAAYDEYAAGYEDVLGREQKKGKSDALPEGWEARYDESMESYYYLNETTGEATWVKPEVEEEVQGDEQGDEYYEFYGANEDGGTADASAYGQSAPQSSRSARGAPGAKREAGPKAGKGALMQETNAFSYDEMTRTWNPRNQARSDGSEGGGGMMMTTRGSLFASLRPRVTPIVVKTLNAPSSSAAGGGGATSSSSLSVLLRGSDEGHKLSQAAQEEKRLRIFRRHLENHGKSKLTALNTLGSLPSLSETGTSMTSKVPPPPPLPAGAAPPSSNSTRSKKKNQQQQQQLLGRPPPTASSSSSSTAPLAVGRLNTPQKLDAVKHLVEGELDKAREELERAKAFHASRAKLTSSHAAIKAKEKEKAKKAKGKKKKGVEEEEEEEAAGEVNAEVWSSMNWSVGPKGFVHPPVRKGVVDFDVVGEKALEAAWSKRRPPPPAEANRFALGVPEPPPNDGPPRPLSPNRQRFGAEMDHHSLLCLHYHTTGNEWTHRNGWDDELHGKRPPGSHVAWFGVHTVSTQNLRVANIGLPKNNLHGPLVDEIRWLDKLKTLSMPNNQLSGCIPPSWSTLTSLSMLDLSTNYITGPVPARFFEGMKRNRDKRESSAVGLKSLNLSVNKLWGEIPYSVSTLLALTSLNLSSNTLSQRLPEGLLSCTSLKTLRLSFNKFTGPLPADLSKLSNLSIFEAAGNSFEGDLPKFPPRLVKLHLQANALTHDLPPSFFDLTALADVNLSDNNLSGALSDDVANLKSLRIFLLTGNRHTPADKDVINDSLKVYLPNLVRQQGFRI